MCYSWMYRVSDCQLNVHRHVMKIRFHGIVAKFRQVNQEEQQLNAIRLMRLAVDNSSTMWSPHACVTLLRKSWFLYVAKQQGKWWHKKDISSFYISSRGYWKLISDSAECFFLRRVQNSRPSFSSLQWYRKKHSSSSVSIWLWRRFLDDLLMLFEWNVSS